MFGLSNCIDYSVLRDSRNVSQDLKQVIYGCLEIVTVVPNWCNTMQIIVVVLEICPALINVSC